MKCPSCGCGSKVVDSRSPDKPGRTWDGQVPPALEGFDIRYRRRTCPRGHSFSTWELGGGDLEELTIAFHSRALPRLQGQVARDSTSQQAAAFLLVPNLSREAIGDLVWTLAAACQAMDESLEEIVLETMDRRR